MIDQGQVTFHGSPRGPNCKSARKNLAYHHRWGTAESPANPLYPRYSCKMASSFRVLGEPNGYANAQPVEPSLEDGYIWLMNQKEDINP